MTDAQAKLKILVPWSLKRDAYHTCCYGHFEPRSCPGHDCPLAEMCERTTNCEPGAYYPPRFSHRQLFAERKAKSECKPSP